MIPNLPSFFSLRVGGSTTNRFFFFFAVDRGMFRWGSRGQQPFPRFDWVQETIFRNPKLQEEGLDSEAPQRPAENILE